MLMTIEELREIVQRTTIVQEKLAQAQLRTDQQILELREGQQETARQLKETDRQLSKQIKELSKQIGGLGNKFGSFTEGMALPSMEKLLRQRFGMETIATRVKFLQNPENQLEIDVLAYANGSKKEVYVVEIKSHLAERGLKQVLDTLTRFHTAFPEHADKGLYGIVATVDASKEMQQRVLEEGLYLAFIHDEHFKLNIPKGFVPRRFEPIIQS
jgi:hypothetical protein